MTKEYGQNERPQDNGKKPVRCAAEMSRAHDPLKKPMQRTIKSVLWKIHDTYLRPGDRRRFLLRELPKGAVGCEIGAWKGEFSSLMLSIAAPSRLYLIDPWLYQPSLGYEIYGGAIAKSQEDMDGICQAVREKFAGDSRVTIIRKKCGDVCGTDIPDGSLDWAYVDGIHEYEPVLADLCFAARKCKPDGIICGDDYGVLFGAQTTPAVTRAVAEFLAENPERELAWVKRSQYLIRPKR